MRGTWRADRHGKRKATGKPLKRVPLAPSRLGPIAREIWQETARRLVGRELLTTLDLAALEGYCIAAERAREAEAVIAKEGRTITSAQGMKRHPELITCEKARAEMRIYEAKFYLTPADRQRANLPEPIDDRDDPLARYLFPRDRGAA